MTRVWQWNRSVTVREVLEDLQAQRSIAYTTVMTVMDNLHQKGFLTREMVGRAYQYEPAQTRAEHNAAVIGAVLAGSSDPAATLMRFGEQMPPEEVAQLQPALASRAPKRKHRGR